MASQTPDATPQAPDATSRTPTTELDEPTLTIPTQLMADPQGGVDQAAENAGEAMTEMLKATPDEGVDPTHEPGVHPKQTNFLAQNKLYIAAGIVGVVVITIAAGVMLSMGSSSRLQGMLDKRLMEQSTVMNVLPEGFDETATFVETEDAQKDEAETEVKTETPKGPSIKAVK